MFIGHSLVVLLLLEINVGVSCLCFLHVATAVPDVAEMYRSYFISVTHVAFI